ncbi:hypothetical protein LTR85_002423 [Meristemomyces frigidus]|nr:hypothetical protein LTR85_002423 [Meristemomyces frigidus]
MASLSRFFNSPTLSDVVVKFGDCSISAHKVILAQHSSYFRDVFTNTVALAHQQEIVTNADNVVQAFRTDELHLSGDRPRAVKGLLAWCYSQKYDGKGNLGPTVSIVGPYLEDCKADEEGAEYVKYLSDLYVAAGKYQVPALRYSAQLEFPTVLAKFDTGEANLKLAGGIARHVFLQHASVPTDLLPPIVAHFTKYIDQLLNMANFWKLLQDVPPLSNKLVRALATGRKVAGTEASPAAAPSVQSKPPASSSLFSFTPATSPSAGLSFGCSPPVPSPSVPAKRPAPSSELPAAKYFKPS